MPGSEELTELFFEGLDVWALDQLLPLAASFDDLRHFRNYAGTKTCNGGHVSSFL